MSSPIIFNPSRDEAWAALCGPPLLLSSINEFSLEGGNR